MSHINRFVGFARTLGSYFKRNPKYNIFVDNGNGKNPKDFKSVSKAGKRDLSKIVAGIEEDRKILIVDSECAQKIHNRGAFWSGKDNKESHIDAYLANQLCDSCSKQILPGDPIKFDHGDLMHSGCKYSLITKSLKKLIRGLPTAVALAIALYAGNKIYLRYFPPVSTLESCIQNATEFNSQSSILWIPREGKIQFPDGRIVTHTFQRMIARDGLPIVLRGPKIYSPEPLEDKIRVLYIGDSIAQSLGVDDSKIASSILEQKLDIEVLDGGVSGYNTDQYRKRIQQLSIFKPDIIIVQLCINDIEETLHTAYHLTEGGSLLHFYGISSGNNEGIKQFIETFLAKRPDKENFENLDELGKYLREAILQFNQGLENCVRSAYEAGARKIIFFPTRIKEELDQNWAYKNTFSDLVRERVIRLKEEAIDKRYNIDIGFVDLLEPFTEATRESHLDAKRFFVDGGHFNELGERVLAKTLAEEIKSLQPDTRNRYRLSK